MWTFAIAVALADDAPPSEAGPSDFATVDPKFHAWDLARRARIGGVVMMGSGLLLGVAGVALAPSANDDLALLGVTVLALETVVPLTMYGVASLVVGHVLEDRSLRGVRYPMLAGQAALILLTASVAPAGLALVDLVTGEPDALPYGWMFVGMYAGAIVLELVEMYDIGRPYGKDTTLSWTVAPTPGGLGVVGQW